MRIIKTDKYEVDDELTQWINLNGGLDGDTVCSEFYVQLEDNADLVVTGYMTDDSTGISLTGFNVGTFEKKSTIDSAGEYLFMTGSFKKLKLEVEGETVVLIREVY